MLCNTINTNTTKTVFTMLKSFIDNFVDVYFHHYADFDGCLGRKQYWLAWLATVIIGLITGFIDGLLFWGLLPIFSTIAGLALLIPGIATGVRRLHDTGRSGLWYLLIFVPIIGSIILLVFFLLPRKEVDNKYLR